MKTETPAKHRDIFRPVRLHQLSHSYFEGGIGSKEQDRKFSDFRSYSF